MASTVSSLWSGKPSKNFKFVSWGNQQLHLFTCVSSFTREKWLIDWLIDCIVFYAASAIIQPYNGCGKSQTIYQHSCAKRNKSYLGHCTFLVVVYDISQHLQHQRETTPEGVRLFKLAWRVLDSRILVSYCVMTHPTESRASLDLMS